MNNTEKLAAALVAQVQDLDDAAMDVFTNFTLDNATGINLDVFGVIVGRERSSANDDAYRDALRGQIRLNRSSGTIEDILEVLTLVFGASVPMALTEGTIAEFEVDVLTSITPDKALRMAIAVGRGKAAGIKANLQFFDATPTFAFDGVGGA
ncbi:hypothetical protein LCGC14_1578910, partial [marine sediment metagenome]